MEMSGQLQGPSCLSPRKGPALFAQKEAKITPLIEAKQLFQKAKYSLKIYITQLDMKLYMFTKHENL
jgi:hypothetical protein